MPGFHDMIFDAKHGGPMDRGSSDRYYGRSYDPHYWPEGTYIGKRVELADMSADQITEYTYGYNNETDRKEW